MYSDSNLTTGKVMKSSLDAQIGEDNFQDNEHYMLIVLGRIRLDFTDDDSSVSQ